MISVIMENHQQGYAIAEILRMFCDNVRAVSDSQWGGESPFEATIISTRSGQCVYTRMDHQSDPVLKTSCRDEKEIKREFKRQLYFVLSQLTGKTFPWGSLTGIRPTLVAREVNNEKELTDIYFVREDKAKLAMQTAKIEDDIIYSVPSDMLSLYIGIPFCPSRCKYCSFISKDIMSNNDDMLQHYIDALILEIDMLGDLIAQVQTVYIGGGTPTVLSEALLHKLLSACARHVDISKIREYTVEAGRPDTVDHSKLKLLKDFGVTRVCINPQTLSNDTLHRMGRKHSVEEFFNRYEMARHLNFSCINTDLIVGLPGETPDIFQKTLDEIIRIHPDNITIHTLYKKRTAQMKKSEVLLSQSDCSVNTMLAYVNQRLEETSYYPYYLYRQKDTVGGHENVGYTLTGKANIYNVAMMSDRFSVLAVGAGGISKRTFSNNRIERCHCVRDPNIYMSRVVEMAQKKKAFF